MADHLPQAHAEHAAHTETYALRVQFDTEAQQKDESTLGMAPPGERFERAHRLAVHIDDRLVVHGQLAPPQRAAQRLLQPCPCVGALAQ